MGSLSPPDAGRAASLQEAARCWTHVLSSPATPMRTFRLVKQAIHALARWQQHMPEREGRGNHGLAQLVHLPFTRQTKSSLETSAWWALALVKDQIG